jgi:hypothetical protein
MTASTVYSDNVTDISANPATKLNKVIRRSVSVVDHKAVLTTSIDEANDVILFGPIPSNAIIRDISILNDDLDAHACPTLAVNVGLYYYGDGNQAALGKSLGSVLDADCIGTASTVLQAAHTTPQAVRFEAADIANIADEAWEIGGLSVDCGGHLLVGLTVSTAAATAAAGDVSVIITYLV